MVRGRRHPLRSDIRHFSRGQMKFSSFAQIRESLGERTAGPGGMNCGQRQCKEEHKRRPYANLYPSFKNGGGNHTSNFSGCPRNPANFVPAAPPKTNYWEERMKMMKTNNLPLSAPTSLQNTISTNSVKMDKSPPNQVEPQLSGPSTSSSTPQENLTAQILQSLVKEVHALTSNIASLLAALQSQSPLSHNIQ
ncbi:hypothetical protein CDAR_168491 [Caerostris darwini]|uniref:Uncharacterized protein n=1 Tax=Caerostris darwini TaxID=1538125 RepID=A0AAV4T692_9ARAC|nr:hypothetical protein CDAR_168491 [Caerostris darwini]